MAGTAGWVYVGRQTAAAPTETGPRRGVPVRLSDAQAANVPLYIRSLGTVQAFNSVLIRSRIDGTLIQIAFREGDFVKEGDVLARIDPRPYQAALDQALAKKAQDEATLNANVLDLRRTQQLATRDFASRQQFDQRTASVAAQEALIRADQAAIDNARTQLDYATIRSPLSGRLGIRQVDQGNIVRASDTGGIVEVAQLQPISVLFTAAEGQLGAIQDAMRSGPVDVVALGPDGRSVLGQGQLALINNEVDTATGTVRLKATFPNSDDRLWPGLSVNTRLLVKTLKDVIVVPDAAVMRGQTELFAFVVGSDLKAQRRVVKIAEFSEGLAVVSDGIKPGERVVIEGQSRLTPGSLVDLPKENGTPQNSADGRAATGSARNELQ